MTWQSWVWLIIADVVIAIAIGKLLKHRDMGGTER